ncbi:2-amino-4-hydroxy-6-hydroxymethyldihydropteridine diphosphokinase [Desulfotalea psychrophila]|uniref:2-amino-4-hydroxy-6-hydroxymethyldihydropteridine pyrophosphokinase n=1 Tax=Desulfotalea psychrophila (strain LSv54 / DSM 12343) TaxID=177439 RepID=Q6AR65_DESPS|nr:2-amino-4-hydroxy-6-hydroxymethyldihydropteridine diphosphokinase [Desulfotalea psychrophila]CAG35159.1 probable 2-amino-4-hydroxy-6-hydroxymethyldihydropteridine pyrophosphokinase [Desulfotalea psychrophila LSv54]
MAKVIAYIGMGSNLGDSRALLLAAWQHLANLKGVETVSLSSPYQSAPVGMESDNLFVNAVGCLRVEISALNLLDQLLATEAHFGRKRSPDQLGYQDRSLDLDLLYYADERMQTARLTLPHPHLADRLFVLSPLREIAPDWQEWEGGRTVTLLEEDLQRRLRLGVLESQDIEKISW